MVVGWSQSVAVRKEGGKPPHAAVRRDGRQRWPEPIAYMSGCSPGALRHGPGGRHPWRAQRRCTPSYPQSNRCYCAPHRAGPPASHITTPTPPRRLACGLWPMACGLSPESYGQREGRRPGWCRAGLAAASCSPCLPPTCIIVQPCLPACLPACLLACFCSSPAALPSAPRFTVHARVPIL
jgi:hypothetical protein